MSAESYNVYYSSGTEEDEFMIPQETKQQIIPTVQPKKKGKVTKKRKRVGRACVFCQRSHMSCDEQRPCKRCVARGCGDQCRDGKRKRRGRRPKGRLVAEEEVDDFEPGYNGELTHDHEHDHENCHEHDHSHTLPYVSAPFAHHAYPNIRVVEADSDDDEDDDGEDEEVEVDVDDNQSHFDARRALQAARFKTAVRHGLLKAEPYVPNQDRDEDSDDSSVTLGGISGRSSPALNDSAALTSSSTSTDPAVTIKTEPTDSYVFPGLWEAVTTAAEQAAEDPCKVEAGTGHIDIDSFFQMDYIGQRAPGMIYGGEAFPTDFDLVMSTVD